MPLQQRLWLARFADALTLARGLAAITLVPLVWSESWTAVAVVLAAAWITDALDGRLSRTAGGGTVLGGWDMKTDTAVGVGLIVGLIGNGTVPWWLGSAVIVVTGGFFLAGNLAAAMLLQLAGFLPTLFILLDARTALWWLPIATAVLIGFLDWRRLFLVNIPTFIRGVAGRFESRHDEPKVDRGV